MLISWYSKEVPGSFSLKKVLMLGQVLSNLYSTQNVSQFVFRAEGTFINTDI